MVEVIKSEYNKFNNMYEELEVQPYNSAYDYFEAGWNRGTSYKLIEYRFKYILKQIDYIETLIKLYKKNGT